MKIKIHNFLALALIALFTFACADKKSPEEMIAGKDSKTWKTVKETNSAGEKEKLSKDETNDVIKFFANGTFVIDTETENSSGKWNYAGNNLTMVFESGGFTQNYTVEELKDDKIKLKAADGATMTLEDM